MKLIITLFILTICSTAFSQTSLLEASKKLIEEKKYETAFNKLNEADPNNDDPDILVAKTDLLLKYFVTSIMHNLFALKDLEADEDIYEIRGSEGSFSMVLFELHAFNAAHMSSPNFILSFYKIEHNGSAYRSSVLC